MRPRVRFPVGVKSFSGSIEVVGDVLIEGATLPTLEDHAGDGDTLNKDGVAFSAEQVGSDAKTIMEPSVLPGVSLGAHQDCARSNQFRGKLDELKANRFSQVDGPSSTGNLIAQDAEVTSQAEVKLAPWVGDSGGLVSLWFVLRAFAAEFAQFVSALATVKSALWGKLQVQQAAGDKEEVLSEQKITQYFRVPLEIGGALASELGLNSVNAQLERIKSEIKFRLTLERTIQLLDSLGERLIDDLERCWFFFVKPQYVEAYKNPTRDWGDVKDNFQSAVYDIEEASKALALERSTATVFHLMRVLERGLRALADDLTVQVAGKNANWNEAIEQLEKRVTKQMPNTDPKAAHRQFYNESILQFRLFKDAIRNYVVHEPVIYNQGQAEGHYNAVRDFMRHLATRLSE